MQSFSELTLFNPFVSLICNIPEVQNSHSFLLPVSSELMHLNHEEDIGNLGGISALKSLITTLVFQCMLSPFLSLFSFEYVVACGTKPITACEHFHHCPVRKHVPCLHRILTHS